jgi:hypothetical protein
MFALPQNLPRLHIVEAAGTQIPAPASAAVTVQLPANSPANQQVKIRGEGFTGNVPVQLVIVPEHSASTQYDLVLDASANPAEVTAVISLPTGEPVKIQAWIR